MEKLVTDAPARAVAGYLARLRARALLVYGARGLCAGSGAAALVLLGCAALTGPVVTPGLSRAVLAIAALTALALGTLALRPVARLTRAHGYGLLATHDPALASRTRSVLELADTREAPSGSHALIAAHAAEVRAQVGRVPAEVVVPARWLRHRSVGLGLLALMLATLLYVGSRGLRAGAHAILFPATITQDGVRIAPIVRAIDVRLAFPSYLARPALSQADFSTLAVPRGTTVELSLRPALAARDGLMRIGDELVRLSAAPNGVLFGRFVARKSATIELRVLHDGVYYQDEKPRALQVLEDRAPSVTLDSALPDTSVVQEADVLTLAFEAEDDHGLASADLLVRLPSGEELRERVWTLLETDGTKPKLVESAVLTVAKLELGPGDVATLWIEARDGDLFSGPHAGVSRAISIELASEASELSLQIPELRAALDAGLDLLANRLEIKLPDDLSHARQRARELGEAGRAWLARLRGLVTEAERASRGIDVDQLRGIADRTQRELSREASAYDAGTSARRLAELDARVVAEHERDVLLLADMLASTLVEEARALTSELSGLKQRMRELLQELRKAPSESKKRELLAEIGKAQRRLRELAQSLSRLAQRVPSEFINREAIPQSEAKGSMDELARAIENGDLDAAEQQLAALEKEIDQLAEHVDSGGARFRESAFGSHDRAVAGARNQLSILAEEQERLARRSADTARGAAQRANARAQASPSSLEAMRSLADELQRELDAFGQASSQSADGQLLGQARERVRDAADALRAGDLAEARRMSDAAQRGLDMLAGSLDQDARMFPGHHGEIEERARAAEQASQRLSRLRDQLDRAVPPLNDFVGAADRDKLRADLQPQRATRERVDQLSKEMGRETDGVPVSPDGEHQLGEVSNSMRRAEEALAQGDPDDASRAQDEAADRLRQLEKSMAQKGRATGERGDRQGERQRDGRNERDGSGEISSGPVRIPSAAQFRGPIEMRRRVLDAMKNAAPDGFRGALQRYYEELLR